jgi:hypothetical protein
MHNDCLSKSKVEHDTATEENTALRFPQSLVPTHYVYNGYLFLQSESLDVDCSGFGFKVYNATFNNISVISLRAVLLVKETGVFQK